MTWAADQPNNQLPALPPGVDLETKAILKAWIPARVALAELKQAGELFPNQGLLTAWLHFSAKRSFTRLPVQILFEQILNGQEESCNTLPVLLSITVAAILASIGATMISSKYATESPLLLVTPTLIYSVELSVTKLSSISNSRFNWYQSPAWMAFGSFLDILSL